MDIVQGRGNNRKVLTFPCAHFVHNSSKQEKIQAKNLLCSILGVDPLSAPKARTKTKENKVA